MKHKDMRILIVATEGSAAAELIAKLVVNISADYSHASSIADARAMLEVTPVDIVIAARDLTDGDALDLIEDDAPHRPPVILIDGAFQTERLATAFRRGAADVVSTPVDYDYLVSRVRSVVRGSRMSRQEADRARRLRQMSSRLVKDRRELRKRVDLICTDIVTAYQRLAEKVVGVLEPTVQIDDGDESFRSCSDEQFSN